MSEKKSIKIAIVGHGCQSRDDLKRMMDALFENLGQEHKHQWLEIPGTTDVVCKICGVKAMRGVLRYKESEE